MKLTIALNARDTQRRHWYEAETEVVVMLYESKKPDDARGKKTLFSKREETLRNIVFRNIRE